MEWIVRKILGSKHERDLRRIRPNVARINELEDGLKGLTDSQLQAKTAEFRDRLARGETLDDIMCEAFAVVKNACRRLCGTRYEVCGHEVVWEMVPFDVQLIGGIALHQGKIAEMATGEGKTLVATMPLYLNSLAGQGVHLVTVNDYLARRDAQWMGLLYSFLGVGVGCIQNDMGPAERREVYGKDITYGTNSEFGFDYLRDNMATRPDDQVQRGYFYAIVDEVDSILIDEARTPLIISGAVPESTSYLYSDLKPRVERLIRLQRDLCNGLIHKAREHLERNETDDAQLCLYQVHQGMPKHTQLMHMLEEPSVRKVLEDVENAMLTDLRKEEARELREKLLFTIDEKGRDANLTDKGCEALNPADPEAYLLPDLASQMSDLDGDETMSPKDKVTKRRQIQESFGQKSERIHAVDQLIRAYCMYEKDVDYVIQDNKVLIVDPFTGRILPGRRWSDGLHQAVEAKEEVSIEKESQTLATITIQNYFRMYKKLAGMTGTAETEASEFGETYHLDVVVIPTNRPVRRVDNDDQIFKTQREKYKAVIDDISGCHSRSQPVLVGTVSVETSELISRMLRRAKIPHSVLNAKQHESEAEIVMRAGQAGAVTIATNMAGRGTDIKLGEGVVWLDRDIILSGRSLKDKRDDSPTLGEQLREKPCGLHVIGSERHEARRIDRQLRGRCARQGDPGSSRFYVSLEDDLMRLFGSERIAGLLDRLGLEEGQVLEHRWLNRSIETAQKRVEQHNFSMRKRTLEYDDVMNKQREVVYTFRGEMVRGADVRERFYDIAWDVISDRAEKEFDEKDETLKKDFVDWFQTTFPVVVPPRELMGSASAEEAATKAFEAVKAAYDIKVSGEDPAAVAQMERQMVLHSIDTHWQDYLRSMDLLREGVGLRAYGQRDPLVEYKREAFDMFESLMNDIKEDICVQMFRSTTNLEAFSRFLRVLPQRLVHDEVSILGRGGAAAPAPKAAGGDVMGADADDGAMAVREAVRPVRRDAPKVGRNDPCPCGSGKKYKKCCGAE